MGACLVALRLFSLAFRLSDCCSFSPVFARFSEAVLHCRTLFCSTGEGGDDNGAAAQGRRGWYTAQIRIKREGKVVYQESQTFDRKQAAQAWVQRREMELAKPGPTTDELDKLLEYFFETMKRRPSSINMPKIIGFAIFSTRPQEEITRIRWANLDEKRRAVLVRNMKQPGTEDR